MNYLHEINICHRDFLFENKVEDSIIKLIDFGYSTKFGGKASMSTSCGTPYYVAPEILRARKYGPECDI